MDYSKLIKSQRKLFDSQITKSVKYRVESLKKLLFTINKYENEIFESLKKDLNKSGYESYLTEIFIIKQEIKTMISNSGKWSKIKKISPSIINFPSKDYILPEPYGVTLHISPWNYPFQLSLGPLIGAVAAGNTVILKPSEHSVSTSALIKKIISESFDQDHVCLILGDSKVATKLLSYRWDYIFFTGSPEIGKIIAKAASINLTPYTLELGGKNPCIVDETVPIELSAKRIIWGKFLNCGQTCIAPDYLIVHNSILGSFKNELKKQIMIAFGEKPIKSESYGKIISDKHILRLKKLIKNQKIFHGGKIDREKKYFEPTIIINPDLDSELMKNEIFGPILPLVTYDNINEIDVIIKKYEKPLGFYIFSKRNKFIKELLFKYSFGGGVVNDSIIQFTNDKLPFGGIGHSGIGSYHGKFSFDTFTHFKPIVIKSFWFDIWVRYAPYPKKFKLIKRLLNII